jgi:hypothetical protein
VKMDAQGIAVSRKTAACAPRKCKRGRQGSILAVTDTSRDVSLLNLDTSAKPSLFPRSCDNQSLLGFCQAIHLMMPV